LKCQYCDSEAVLPFKCALCAGYFCPEHRLPENHGCPEIWKASQPKDRQEVSVKDVRQSRQEYRDYEIPAFRARTKVFRFSGTELKHLIIGTLIVFGVGFSIFFQGFQISRFRSYMLIGSALVFTLTFILHEIAHKMAAQHHGLWAEFRLTLFGSLITLFSIVSPFKIVSPGVVHMAGVADKKIIGKVSLAGPLTNIILSAVFLSLSYYGATPFITVGAVLNAWTALFNLIPFSVFDGEKIFWWNRKAWAVNFAASIALIFFGLRFFLVFP